MLTEVSSAHEISGSPMENLKSELDSLNKDESSEVDHGDDDYTSDDREHETDDDSSDEYDSDYKIMQHKTREHEFYQNYIKETEGFDIPPTSIWRSFIQPVYSADSEANKHALKKYERLIRFAIDDFHRKHKNTKLELEKVLKVHRKLELHYFTFLAKDVSSGETKTYQCKVFDSHFRTIGAKVGLFREKPKDGVEFICFPPYQSKKQTTSEISICETHNKYLTDSSGDDSSPDGDNSHAVSNDKDSDDDSDLEDELRAQVLTYKKWIRKLDGFDLPFVPDYFGCGNGLYGAIVPYYSADHDNIPEESLRGYSCLLYAIEDYNEKQNTQLELVKVLKLNVRYSLVTYYFTFLAKDISTGEIKTYQTKVFHTGIEEIGEIVMIFREKTSEKLDSSLSEADLPKTYQFWRY